MTSIGGDLPGRLSCLGRVLSTSFDESSPAVESITTQRGCFKITRSPIGFVLSTLGLKTRETVAVEGFLPT
jgi:hypothetical protein